jgi:hypothetical protein
MPAGGGGAGRRLQEAARRRGRGGGARSADGARPAARLLLGLLAAAVSVACAAAQAVTPPAAAAAAAAAAPNSKANIHTLVLSDCSPYADWQTLALAFSHRDAGQSGPLTRVMSCTDQEAKEHDKGLVGIVTTHIAPSYSTHPRTGDRYVAYNKPSAVGDWLKHFTPEEEWILILEADMLLRHAVALDGYPHLKGPGYAVGARYEQLVGVKNQLAERHLADVAPRNDWLAGPPGRRADQVGGFLIIHRDDLRRVAPFWLKYTEDVREDADVSRRRGREGGGAVRGLEWGAAAASCGPAGEVRQLRPAGSAHRRGDLAFPSPRRGSTRATRWPSTRATSCGSRSCTATPLAPPRRTCGTTGTTRRCPTPARCRKARGRGRRVTEGGAREGSRQKQPARGAARRAGRRPSPSPCLPFLPLTAPRRAPPAPPSPSRRHPAHPALRHALDRQRRLGAEVFVRQEEVRLPCLFGRGGFPAPGRAGASVGLEAGRPPAAAGARRLKPRGLHACTLAQPPPWPPPPSLSLPPLQL